MRWLYNLKKISQKGKKRLVWVLGVGLVLGLIYAGILLLLTPYDKGTAYKSQFYDSSKQGKVTDLRATVLEVEESRIKVRLQDGPRSGDIQKIPLYNITPKVGDTVLVTTEGASGSPDYVSSFWRIPGLIGLSFLFVLVVFLVSGRRGIASLGGLIISVFAILFGMIPAILAGVNAFWACVITAFFIATFAVVVAHGFRWRTFVSLLSIYAVLTATILLALLGEKMGYLTGIYDETSALLRVRDSMIDLRGVLIGGIIIATLGVLDDIITTQTATVDEIHKANKNFRFWNLFLRGHSVGNEHVVALVNTLALAYIGVSLPTVLALYLNISSSQNVIYLFNSEFIAQEIVRTLVSSIALVVAVPIATAVAAYFIPRKRKILDIINVRRFKTARQQDGKNPKVED